jgi:hypothetical protein
MEATAKNKVGALHTSEGDREYAPPPPPRESRQKHDELDDALGGLSGAGSGAVEQRRADAPAGGRAGEGYLGGKKSETADKKVQSEGAAGPARDQAPRPAPVTVRSAQAPASAAPPPAPAQEPRAVEKESQQQASRKRAAAPASAPAAAPAEADSLEELSKPAPAKARKGNDGTSALQERVEKANQAFTASRWDEAATAYRELLRLYPDNKAVPVWKARVRACEQARLQSQ